MYVESQPEVSGIPEWIAFLTTQKLLKLIYWKAQSNLIVLLIKIDCKLRINVLKNIMLYIIQFFNFYQTDPISQQRNICNSCAKKF